MSVLTNRGVLTAALVLATLPATAGAQAKFWGVTAGATSSDIQNYYGGASTDSRWGGTAGFLFGVRTYRSTSVAIEPTWLQRGGGDIRTDYLDLPITFGAVVRSANDVMRYGFYTGIGVAFKLGCSDGSGLSTNACTSINGSDWTVPIGFRLLRRAGSGFAGVDLKYAIPLDSSFDPGDINTRTWAFRLLYVKGIGAP